MPDNYALYRIVTRRCLRLGQYVPLPVDLPSLLYYLEWARLNRN